MVLLDIDNKHHVHLRAKEALHLFYHNGYDDALKSARLTGYTFAKTKEEAPVIPSPDMFDFEELPGRCSLSSASAQTNPFRFPSIAECATHLELLEVFYVLRQRVLRSPEIDVAMGIHPVRETKTGHNGDTKTFKDPKLWERRQVKWPKFVEFAVVRFLEWRKVLSTSGYHDNKFYLPPLDVLMVWHSFLLNPRLFQEHCGDEPLYRTRMPWQKIHESIDNGEWNFRHHPGAVKGFETATGLDADLFEQFSRWAAAPGSEDNNISCSASEDDDDHDHDSVEPRPSTDFQSDNPKLTAFKLNHPSSEEDDGYSPPSPSSSASPISSPVLDLYLNRRGPSQAQLYAFLFHTARTAPAFTDTTCSGSQSDTHSGSVPDSGSSSSPKNLATQLFEAVQRQTTFIDKMNAHLWIRSPFLGGTITRAIHRYQRFLTLLKFHGGKGSPIVPTLDIDLVWHTHQCSSGLSYVRDMKSMVGRFINHDDSIPREGTGGLDDGFKRTRRLWRVRFGGEYKGCGCWDCEGLLDELQGTRGGCKEGLEDADIEVIAKKVHARVMYYRFVEFARRKKLPLPVWVPPPSE